MLHRRDQQSLPHQCTRVVFKVISRFRSLPSFVKVLICLGVVAIIIVAAMNQTIMNAISLLFLLKSIVDNYSSRTSKSN